MKKVLIILIVVGSNLLAMGQHIPVPLTQVRLYDFIDELLTDGIICLREKLEINLKVFIIKSF